MKKNRLHLVFLLWFMASMSIANTHVHHDLNEHSHCVKCYAHDTMNGADIPVAVFHFVEPVQYDSIILPEFTDPEKIVYSCINARAPPLS